MLPQLEHLLEECYGAWRYRWTGLIVAWCVGVTCWLLVLIFWRDTYQANARVFVDTRTALKPVLEGLAVAQDVDAQLNYVRQSLLGTPQLERIAIDTGLLNPAVTQTAERIKVIEDMRDRIVVNVRAASDAGNERGSGGNVYGLAYKDPIRDRSLAVVKGLLRTLVEDTLGGKMQGSADAQKFLETRIKEYEGRLRAAEQRLAAFKKSNVGVMPSEQGGYFTRLQGEIEAVRTTESALAVAESRREELQRQLRGESAVSAAAVMSVSPGMKDAAAGSSGDVLSRIRETQARLDELLLKFTDKHPDVVATRETLDELKRRRDREIEALRNGDPDAVANSGASTNPIYQSVQVALNQSEVDIATLRQQLHSHRVRVAELRQALDTMPQVEAQYSQLNRDYDVNKTQFTALLTQLEKAKLGQEADSSGSVRFDVIEPPNVGFRPVMPSRLVLIVLSLVVAIAAGAAVAYVQNLLRPVFWSRRRLATQMNVPVLGAVGPAFPKARAHAVRQDMLRFGGGTGALILLLGVLLLADVLVTHMVAAGLPKP